MLTIISVGIMYIEVKIAKSIIEIEKGTFIFKRDIFSLFNINFLYNFLILVLGFVTFLLLYRDPGISLSDVNHKFNYIYKFKFI